MSRPKHRDGALRKFPEDRFLITAYLHPREGWIGLSPVDGEPGAYRSDVTGTILRVDEADPNVVVRALPLDPDPDS